jgi:hypothetical protein
MSHDPSATRVVVGSAGSASTWSLRPPELDTRSKTFHACPPSCAAAGHARKRPRGPGGLATHSRR